MKIRKSTGSIFVLKKGKLKKKMIIRKSTDSKVSALEKEINVWIN